MSKPTKTGYEGGKAVFTSNGKHYTAPLTQADIANLNVAQARALVTAGAAVEVPYLKQFPWLN